MFPKYLMDYQNVKIVKSKLKVRKVTKTNIKSNVVSKKPRKKDIRIDMMSVM